MSKTPFEIRADILALTKDYFDKQMQLNLEVWKKSVEFNSRVYPEPQMPKMYTAEELIEATEKFYSFVTTKK